MERQWMRHPETGGYFAAPEAAIEDWKQLGWEPADPPPAEPSPVVAERIAWEKEQEAVRSAATTPPGVVPAAKPRSRQSAATNPEE